MCSGKRFDIKRYSSAIACVICLIGCAAQIYEVANDFYTNETITKRLLSHQVGLPGISLCISKLCSLGTECNRQGLSLNNETTEPQSNQTQRGRPLDLYDKLDALNSLSIDDQQERSLPFEHLFKKCTVPAENNSWIPCEQVYRLFKYLTLEDDCFMLTERGSWSPDQGYLHHPQRHNTLDRENPFRTRTDGSTFQRASNLPKVDFQRNRPIEIRLFKPFAGRRVELAFHSRNISWDHFEHNFLKLSPHRYTKTSVSYEMIRIESLKSPFKTKCIDYREHSRHGSKGRCIAVCLIQYYRRHFKRWPPQVPARYSPHQFASYKMELIVNSNDFNGNNTNGGMNNENLNSTGNQTRSQLQHGDIRSRCEHICDRGVSCIQDLFEPFVIKEQQSLLPDDEHFDLQVYAPKYVIQFRYEPKTPVIHFLCYVGSTTNLWLGISFLALLKYIHSYSSQWLHERRAAKRRKLAMKLGKPTTPEVPAFQRATENSAAVRENQYANTYSQPGQFDAAW